MKDKPLNVLEHMKLIFYRLLFKRDDRSRGKAGRPVYKTRIWDKVEQLLTTKPGGKDIGKELQQDFEELDDRNQAEVDKLLDMLAKDPEKALKYALPLDDNGSVRGSTGGSFTLLQRWMSLSWANAQTTQTGRGTVNLGDRYYDLRKQYMATAEDLTKRKKYHDAAFVYMKLLKNPYKAAEVLEMAGLYEDAATIFLKHANAKTKAAECYEKGNMPLEAIALYKEFGENEKVGDLYTSIARKKEADIYYHKVTDDHKSRNRFLKAALIYKDKMGDMPAAQDALMQGWKTNKDPVNCLTSYFANIEDSKELKKELDAIYRSRVDADFDERFLYAIKHVHQNRADLSDDIREIAYEIIAANVSARPSIITELKTFNPNDRELMKDTLRYKVRNKK